MVSEEVAGGRHAGEILEVVNHVGLIAIAAGHRRLGPIDGLCVLEESQGALEAADAAARGEYCLLEHRRQPARPRWAGLAHFRSRCRLVRTPVAPLSAWEPEAEDPRPEFEAPASWRCLAHLARLQRGRS